MEKKKKKITKGGRNLVILGLASTLIAMTTTGVSLAIYHNSGDIYLDRSRPGYLPDEEEIEEEEERGETDEYVFPKDEKLTKEVLEKYLQQLDEEVKALDSYEEPFGAEVLSDEHLGITESETPDGANSEMPDGAGNEFGE